MIRDSVQFVIPSHRRVERLQDKSLGFLERMGVPAERIHVFCSDAQDWSDYQPLVRRVQLHRGRPTNRHNRYAISDAFQEGVPLVWLDDDVDDLVVLEGEKDTAPITPEGFDQLVSEAFGMCRAVKATLWGIYAVPNGFFMKPNVRTGLAFCAGPFYGTINSHEADYRCQLDYKDDYERCIRHWLIDGAIVRYDHVAMKTAFYKGEGGQSDLRTMEGVAQTADYLCNHYGELVSPKKTAKETAEVTLRTFPPRRPLTQEERRLLWGSPWPLPEAQLAVERRLLSPEPAPE